MYHLVGVTPEAATLEAAFGPKHPVETIRYGKAEQRRTYETLNANGHDHHVDYVMLGCPHASIDQLAEIARLLEGRHVHENSALWVFTSRAVKATAVASGHAAAIEKAGGRLLTDTCSAISQAVPKGTRVAAFDSAKQTHYLPQMMNIEGWFGTTQDCINAACTAKWEGSLN